MVRSIFKREEASPDEIIRYSEILAKNNHIKKGEPILKKYTEQYPNDHRLWSRYGYFTLWLGKKQIAIKAFENALELRPYFKEAMDGLDLAKGKGYIYTINDTSHIRRYNYGLPPKSSGIIYPIDKYYAKLKKEPENDEIRFKLIEELLKAKRYEEAYEESNKLYEHNPSFEGIDVLRDSVISVRNDWIDKKIEEYKADLEKDPNDKEALLKLAENYSKIRDYDSALDLYDRYLKLEPNNEEIIFQYAKVAAWNKDFQSAIEKMDQLLAANPDKFEYQLFRGQLGVWLGQKDAETENYLSDALRKQPENIDALIAMALLKMHQQDFDVSQEYIDKVKQLDPENKDLAKLESDFEFQKLRAEQEKLFEILQEGRKLAMDERCDEAIPLYEEYLSKAEPNNLIKKEYADVQACAKNYDTAIDLYSELLNENYDFETALQRAKVYYFANDSVKALEEFEKLAENNPNDFVVNMYLGDSYTKMHQYSDARDVYERIIEDNADSNYFNTDSTKIAMINQRLNWVPVTGFLGMIKSFPNYAALSPKSLFYADNYNFQFSTVGMRAELGLLNGFSGAVSFERSNLKNNVVSREITSIDWMLYLKIGENLRADFSFGTTHSIGESNKATSGFSLTYEQKDRLKLSGSYERDDARLLLYSSSIINSPLNATIFRLTGNYKHPSKLRISGYFHYFAINDDNRGNNLQLRIGKEFYPDVELGYEYYYSNFKYTSSLYYSPTNFESHSLWADWIVEKNEDYDVKLGGKLGYFPASDFLIREVYCQANYKPLPFLTFSGTVNLGSSYRYDTSYNSFSILLAAYWSL